MADWFSATAADPPELVQLEGLINDYADLVTTRVLATVVARGRRFPLYAILLGNPAPDIPAIGFFGGVHGVERIGTQVLLSFLSSLLERLRWDDMLRLQLRAVRMVFMPLVNPAGMWLRTRANGNGVDLMRNAPVECRERPPSLLGGQRYSSRLPWYRGKPEAMEAENDALCALVREELLPRPFSIALDCHSGFGMRDRIWFPFAHSRAPLPHLAEIHALTSLFARTYPSHNYLVEPQSRQYMTHGDVWDYLYMESINTCASKDRSAGAAFLPLTLEMGSWLWVKKNPQQLLTRLGLFNPLPPHRLQRVLRRHINWLNFLGLATASWQNWQPQGAERTLLHAAAEELWFKDPAP